MAQTPAQGPSGLQRFPVVTAAVLAVTAVLSVLGLVLPGVLEARQRTPAGLHG